MAKRPLDGNGALALGALAAGVELVASYPGSPSSGTVEALIKEAQDCGIYVEWSCNEKVALEMGIGASIAGRRSLICAKSVGLNLMLDPLMALNLTPIHGGLVILVGDDPGAYGSQNEQDSRLLAPLLEMPMMEPANPAESYDMMIQAYAASEQYNTPMIIRETRGFAQRIETTEIEKAPIRKKDLGLLREQWRFVPIPGNVVAKHAELHRRVMALREWAEGLPYNRIIGGGEKAVIASGYVYRKLLDVVGEEVPKRLRMLKLSSLFPLPERLICRFLSPCAEVMVLEENEPYLERQIGAIAHSRGLEAKICGRLSGHIGQLEGELFRWKIQQALTRFLPGYDPAHKFLSEEEAQERPGRKDHCRGCGYDRILDKLEEAAASLHQKPVLIGDPGCLVTVADRLDAKYAMGSAVGVATGMAKAGAKERAIALFGDSSFFHTSLPAICNAAHNRSDILMVVLDNGAAATTGFQPGPGVGRDAMGGEAPALSMEQIARACGVPHVVSVRGSEIESRLAGIFREALERRKLTLIIVRTVDQIDTVN